MAQMEGPKKGAGAEHDLKPLVLPQPADEESRAIPPVQSNKTIWEWTREAERLPLNVEGRGDFESLRTQRRMLYEQALEQTDQFKADPDACPFLLRERLLAWLGLLADLAPMGEAGKIAREDPKFHEYYLGAKLEMSLLTKACVRDAATAAHEDDRVFLKSLSQSMDALLSRYLDETSQFDFTITIREQIPTCIDSDNLTTYVNALRKLGCDRAGGWYVDGEGKKHKLFSYDRMKEGVMVAMRSSGKAVTGLVAVRFLEEYRRAREPNSSLATLLDTPFLDLCPKFKAQIETTHKNDSSSIENWRKITFRQLISHTSGLPNSPEKKGSELFRDLISLKPGGPQSVGFYCNPGFDVINLALEEIIESSPGEYLGATTLGDFAAKVLRTKEGEQLDICTLSIPQTPTTTHPIPQGRGMACSTLEGWTLIPEILKEQPTGVVAALLDERSVNVGQRGYIWRAGGGFWLENYGLSTNGDRNNFSFIIPQEPRGERAHNQWISESLHTGYIIIVRQTDAPIIPCDFDTEQQRAAEGLLHRLFRKTPTST